jgi:hypothetical protein
MRDCLNQIEMFGWTHDASPFSEKPVDSSA